MLRVVWEMDTQMSAVESTSAVTRLVLPAPEGAETVYRMPRPVCFSNMVLTCHCPAAKPVAACLFDILNLLAHLLNHNLELHCRLGAVRGNGLGGEGIGFPVELLHEEVQP